MSVGLRDLTDGSALPALLYTWVMAFAVGELLLALGLVQAKRVPRWVPGLMVIHVGVSPLAPMLPQVIASLVALTVTIAFAALGIVANQRSSLVR